MPQFNGTVKCNGSLSQYLVNKTFPDHPVPNIAALTVKVTDFNRQINTYAMKKKLSYLKFINQLKIFQVFNTYECLSGHWKVKIFKSCMGQTFPVSICYPQACYFVCITAMEINMGMGNKGGKKNT